MLKIVGGKHRGRAIATPEGEKTRPTSSRAREALFNILIHANWTRDGTSPLIDARVLDAFAGSGALGLEALSRGARTPPSSTAIPRAIKLIGENLRSWAKPRRPRRSAPTSRIRRQRAKAAILPSSIHPIAQASPHLRSGPWPKPAG